MILVITILLRYFRRGRPRVPRVTQLAMTMMHLLKPKLS